MQKNEDCYPQEIFLSPSAIKKFICPIDFGVCRDPVLDQCGHSFGRFCINQWVNKKNTCPLTNNAYSENPVFPENYAIKEFLNDLTVRCLNHEKFCNWEGILENLDGHLKKECGVEIISCQNENCEKKMMRKELDEHLKTECQYTEIDCVFMNKGCDQRMQRRLWATHLGEVHHMQLKEIMENYEKNVRELSQCIHKINEQQSEIDILRKTQIGKDEYYEVLHENNRLKDRNNKLQEEIQELEFRVKETCLKLLDKEKEAKMMESRLSTIKEREEITNLPAPIVNGPSNQTSNLKTFIKSHTMAEDLPPKKVQNNADFTHNLYNYPPQSLVYNPITGQDLSQTRQYAPIMPMAEQKSQLVVVDNSIYDFPAHDNMINYLLLFTTNDGRKLLASAGVDNQVKIWDIMTYQLVKSLSGHVSAVTCLLFNQTYNTLLSGGNDATVRLWNCSSWECLRIIDARSNIRCMLRYSNASFEFLTGGLDNKIRVWRSEKGTYSHETLASLAGEVCSMETIGFEESCEILAGDSKGFVYLIREDPTKRSSYFNSFVNKICKSQKCHDSKILSIKYIKEKNVFVSCSLSDPKLKVHDKATFQQITELSLCMTGYCINDIKYDVESSLVILGTSDEKIISISSLDWNIKKTYEREGYGVNNIECDLKGGCLYSCGAYRDKKDGKYKYIIRVRRI